MNKKATLELTTSFQDWLVIRDCLVEAFHDYPLYQYIVPEESKRDEFLRGYLDANYEVTVGSGKGLILGGRVAVNENDDGKEATNNAPLMKLIGGLLIIPPAWDQSGWAINDDKPYWDAYEKYKLAEISAKGLERLKRYELWENTNVCKKIENSGMPIGNGLFAGMLPEYTAKGYGSYISADCVKILWTEWMKDRKQKLKSKDKHSSVSASKSRLRENSALELKESSSPVSCKNESILEKCERLSANNRHCYSLLSHRMMPPMIPHYIKISKRKENEKLRSENLQKNAVSVTKITSLPSNDPDLYDTLPVAASICHGETQAHFYSNNKFKIITNMPYHDEIENVTPFRVFLLAMDPFKTGKIQKLQTLFSRSETTVRKQLLSHL